MSKTIKKGFVSDEINGISINKSLKCDSDNFNNNTSRKITYIVMHYTGNAKDTAKANANYFASPNRQASAHFFVDNTNIYQSVELRDTAWHCGAKTYYHNTCRNANSIGIEMCCTAGNFTIADKTIKNAAYLCAYLCEMIGIKAKNVDKYVLRHYDVTHKTCPAQMVNNKTEWTEFKQMVKNILEGKNIDGKIKPYLVKITSKTLDVNDKADKKSKVNTTVKKNEVYTIVDEKDGWGKLKSGAGWIYLKKTKKV